MKIGSPEHKAWQQENSEKLKMRLQKTVAEKPTGEFFSDMRQQFARNLLRGVS